MRCMVNRTALGLFWVIIKGLGGSETEENEVEQEKEEGQEKEEEQENEEEGKFDRRTSRRGPRVPCGGCW